MLLRHLISALARNDLDHLLAELDNLDEEGYEPITISRANERTTLTLTIKHNDSVGAKPIVAKIEAAQASPALKLGRIHRKILEKASPTEAIPAKRLIALAGYKDNSYSWEAITHLSRARLILRTPDGYLKVS